MGQVPSIPSSHWSTCLLFEADSLSNNIITCNELGIQYRIYTPLTIGIFKDPVTSIYRWDNETQQEMLIAEIEKLVFSSQRIRMAPGTGLDALGPSAPFVPVGEFFPKTGVWSNNKRIFVASNGRQYIWKSEDGTVYLYPSDNKYLPLGKLKQSSLFTSTPMHLKLTSGCVDILDELLVTCIIAEKKRRNRQKKRRS